MNEATIKEALAKVIDPALGKDIVTYRILKSIEIQVDGDSARTDSLMPAAPTLNARESASRSVDR